MAKSNKSTYKAPTWGIVALQVAFAFVLLLTFKELWKRRIVVQPLRFGVMGEIMQDTSVSGKKPPLQNTKMTTLGLRADGDSFTLDGRPFFILSGSFHYFRTHPALWADRLLRMKAAGLNTVTTYIPWNMHERIKGQTDFVSEYSLIDFIKEVKKMDMYLIVRPGPYICAEWEWGGLPSWLLREPDMKVRSSSSQTYLRYVESYFSRLLPLLGDHTYKKGGPIIAFQVENEFGSYSKDPEYLRFLCYQFKRWNVDELLFTSDGRDQLPNGTLLDVYATINFGSDPEDNLLTLKRMQPNRPLMVTEYWAGWFDHWGEGHHIAHVEKKIPILNTILDMNSSVNVYMFVGGTNFGFWNGANQRKAYESGNSYLYPTITSYDYDAAVSECGDLTEKYHLMRQSFLQHRLDQWAIPPIPNNPAKKAYGKVGLGEQLDFQILEHLVLSKGLVYKDPIYMEFLPINSNSGQSRGWILYRTKFSSTSKLTFKGKITDRAQVFINGIEHTIFSYWDNLEESFDITINRAALLKEGNTLDLLIENMGRVNYLHLDGQHKGFSGSVVTAEGNILSNWEHVPFEFCHKYIELLRESPQWKQISRTSMPCVYRGTLNINTDPADTFLLMDNWYKGIVIFNGFNLGRYWNIGPQRTLYVPGPLVRRGANDIIIFETNPSKVMEPSVEFIDRPILG